MPPKGEPIPPPKNGDDPGKKLPPGVDKKNGANQEVQAVPQPVTAPALEVAPRSGPSPF